MSTGASLPGLGALHFGSALFDFVSPQLHAGSSVLGTSSLAPGGGASLSAASTLHPQHAPASSENDRHEQHNSVQSSEPSPRFEIPHDFPVTLADFQQHRSNGGGAGGGGLPYSMLSGMSVQSGPPYGGNGVDHAPTGRVDGLLGDSLRGDQGLGQQPAGGGGHPQLLGNYSGFSQPGLSELPLGGYVNLQQERDPTYLSFPQDPYFDNRGFPQDPRIAAGIQEALERLELNPLAREYVPPPNHGVAHGRPRSGYKGQQRGPGGRGQQVPNCRNGGGGGGRTAGGRGGKRGGGSGGGGGGGGHKNLAANVRRTIYICDIDSQVTEHELAIHFQDCGNVIDCRVCGDPNSAMRFAFIEFTNEESVTKALLKSGTMLGPCPLRVLRSKTAIVPVNNEYLPRSHHERERCVKTVYAANIDKKVERNEVRHFFESLCGKVSKLRLLGDYQHSTRIAFVEFEHADSAAAALDCSGLMLGSLPVRVSPSKTHVRDDPRVPGDEAGEKNHRGHQLRASAHS